MRKGKRSGMCLWVAAVIAALSLTGCAGKLPALQSGSAQGTIAADETPAESAGQAAEPPKNSDRAPEKLEKPEETAQPKQSKNGKKTAAAPEQTTAQETDSPAQEQPEPENCVHAQWAEEVFSDLSDYEQFILGMDEELPLVYFSTERTVEDFKVLSLALESIGEDGSVRFRVKEADTIGTMTADVPLLVRMELMGTIPNNGISYVDASGKTRCFALEVSGYDGSLLLTEFLPAT